MTSSVELARVSDENYGEYMAAPAAVVMFKIANCAKCEEFEPIVAEAADRFGKQVRFGKAMLHVPGACREIKRKYRFSSFPTTHFYKQGKLVHEADEKLSKEALSEAIEKHLL